MKTNREGAPDRCHPLTPDTPLTITGANNPLSVAGVQGLSGFWNDRKKSFVFKTIWTTILDQSPGSWIYDRTTDNVVQVYLVEGSHLPVGCQLPKGSGADPTNMSPNSLGWKVRMFLSYSRAFQRAGQFHFLLGPSLASGASRNTG